MNSQDPVTDHEPQSPIHVLKHRGFADYFDTTLLGLLLDLLVIYNMILHVIRQVQVARERRVRSYSGLGRVEEEEEIPEGGRRIRRVREGPRGMVIVTLTRSLQDCLESGIVK
jgi:hypothetical protein